MTAPRRLSHALLASCFALAALSSCAEEDTRLFKEPGVWALTHFSEDGETIPPVNAPTHQDAFLLDFDRDLGVMATAACSFGGGNTPQTTTCGAAGSPSDKDWECKCYAYEFEDSTMRMSPFEAGGQPGPVGSSDTDGDGSTFDVDLTVFPEIGNSYIFKPLPGGHEFDADGLFGSNGVNSTYVFNKQIGRAHV